MSFRLVSISFYFWSTLDSIRKIYKFETVIHIIVWFTITFKWVALKFSLFFNSFILKTPDNFFLPLFAIRSISTLKSLGNDDNNYVSKSLFNDETTFSDCLSNNLTKCLSVLFKTAFHCSKNPGDIPLIPSLILIYMVICMIFPVGEMS